jgi:CHAT domain-containing protein
LEASLQFAQNAFQKYLDQLLNESGKSELAKERVFQLQESQGLMEDLRELGSGAVALYTLVGGGKYRIILVTPDIQKAFEYPIKDADLNQKVAAFREVLQDPKLDPLPLAHELYKILVAPVAKDLEQAHAETLMWSLDGVLRYVPIAALHDGKQYMVERYRNVIFTPASNSRLKDQASSSWKGLGLGVSKAQPGASALPNVPEELRSIIRDETAASTSTGGVLPGTVLLDEAFTAEAMKAALHRRYALVHIASHFAFRPGNETNSALLLGDGSFMTLAEIKTSSNLFSGVELLTLSACDTATGGADADGKEVEGFGVLAQRQGAKAVVASLWPVADEATRLLMQNFYARRNAAAGVLKSEALRQAQLDLLNGKGTTAQSSQERQLVREQKSKAGGLQPEALFKFDPKAPYSHPYYWAPFILIGNWK